MWPAAKSHMITTVAFERRAAAYRQNNRKKTVQNECFEGWKQCGKVQHHKRDRTLTESSNKGYYKYVQALGTKEKCQCLKHCWKEGRSVRNFLQTATKQAKLIKNMLYYSYNDRTVAVVEDKVILTAQSDSTVDRVKFWITKSTAPGHTVLWLTNREINSNGRDYICMENWKL